MTFSKTSATVMFMILLVASYAQDAEQQSTSGEFPVSGIDVQGYFPDPYKAHLQTTISGVPAFDWYRGCGPTALGMVLAYYDAHGFPLLFPGDATTQTTAVNGAIASSGHYSDYSLPIDYSPILLDDKSELPAGDEHADDCIADFMHTSRSFNGNYWGWSWTSGICDGFNGYLSLVPAYSGFCQTFTATNFSWNALTTEIDANRPLMFLVDTDGDGSTDHFITVIGYYQDAGVNYYGCYHTWDQSIHWYEFRQIQSGVTWGISRAFTFMMGMTGVAEDAVAEEFSIYPMPVVTDEFVVKLNQKPASTVQITLIDMNGRRISLPGDEIASASGDFSLRIILPESVKSGIYILNISDTRQSLIKMIPVLRDR